MRTIRIKKHNNNLADHKEDVAKIQDALIDKGFYATNEQCAELWEIYSENIWAAGWLSMNNISKEEIYNLLKYYFEPGPESSLDTKYI
jgi:hypothetical protein